MTPQGGPDVVRVHGVDPGDGGRPALGGMVHGSLRGECRGDGVQDTACGGRVRGVLEATG